MPRHPLVAATSQGLSDRVYSALADRARRMPGPVFPLHVGDTWLQPPDAARDEARDCAHRPRSWNYSPIQGEPVLLDAIRARVRARHGAELDPECLQVMPGATTGLAVAVAALLEPGDELLLPSPFWPLIRGIARGRGCVPVEVPFFTRLSEPGFDAERILEEKVTPRTAAIYVNTPHNPTGRVLPGAAVEAIAQVARRHDLWVISDEAYEDLAYGTAPAPLWRRGDLEDRTVAMHTLSKSFALAGARIGYAHGPAGAMQAVRGVQAFDSYCAARPMQLAAARALAGGEAWLAGARRLYAEAGRAAAEAAGVPAPEAGTFLFLDVAPSLRPGEGLDGFLERCLAAGVLVTPGPACGQHFATWVRLCFTAVPPDDLRQALERLGTVLRPGHG
jgi:N-succinyldiaminopimelate aminotransferase